MSESWYDKTLIAWSAAAEDDRVHWGDTSAPPSSRDRTMTRADARRALHCQVVSQAGHGFTALDPVRHDGSDWVKSTADTEANARVIGVVVAAPDADTFILQVGADVIDQTGLTAGSVYYLQDAGGLGTSAGTVDVPVLLADSATSGWLLPLGAGGGGGASSMDGLSDADTTTQAPTSDDSLRFDGSDWVPLKHNLSASAGPTSTDDADSDYEPGSLWVDTTNNKAYVCLNATAGSAVWTEITQAGSGSTTLTGLSDTPGSYSSGDAGKHLAVNSAENAVEFVDPNVVSVNAQTGTSYTLIADDAGKVVELTNASAITLTVPPNSSVAFAVGTIIALEQGGAGTVTVSPGSGVTINSKDSNTDLAGQYATAALRKDATDTWVLTGNLA